MLPTIANAYLRCCQLAQDAVYCGDGCCANSTAVDGTGGHQRTTPASQAKSSTEVGQTAESGGFKV